MSTPEDRKRIEDFQLEVLKRKAALLPRFEKYCDEKGLKFRAPVEEIYDYCVLEYSFALWQWGTPVSSIPATTASDDKIFAHLLDISNPDYFIADSPTASFFVQAPASWAIMATIRNLSRSIFPSNRARVTCIA